jgi:hypothetical protein
VSITPRLASLATALHTEIPDKPADVETWAVDFVVDVVTPLRDMAINLLKALDALTKAGMNLAAAAVVEVEVHGDADDAKTELDDAHAAIEDPDATAADRTTWRRVAASLAEDYNTACDGAEKATKAREDAAALIAKLVGIALDSFADLGVRAPGITPVTKQ